MTDPQNDIRCNGCRSYCSPNSLRAGLCRDCRRIASTSIGRMFGTPGERPADADLRREIAASTYDGGLHRLPTEVCDGR